MLATETNTDFPVWLHSLEYQTVPANVLITLDSFHHGRDSIFFLMEKIFIVNMDLPFMNVLILPKLSSMGLQNALFTVMLLNSLYSKISTTMGPCS